MIEGEPSQTALHVAAARAAHLRYDPSPHILVDECAEALLGERAEALIPSYADGRSFLLLENRLAIPLRARYGEDRLAAAYADGVRQLVVLGAGLDSYAFRRPTEQAELQVYEVDHPSTQAWKTARLAELAWEVPDFLTFVPCDFEKTPVSEVLKRTRFVESEPAVVTWMGVVYYLEPETARQALVDLHGILAPRSEVVFDYQFPFEDLPERYSEIPKTMNSYLKGVGEPQQNRYRRAELREVILAAGYAEALLPEPEELYARYYAPLATPIPMSERFGLAVARR
jgi:methyltransferase (TIGR00027 family)